MKRVDFWVTSCLLLVASSFWLFLAWAYFTNQSKDSFYVGPAVVGVAVTFAIDVMLVLLSFSWAVTGLIKKRVFFRQVALKWLVLFVVPVPSYILANLASIHLLKSLYP